MAWAAKTALQLRFDQNIDRFAVSGETTYFSKGQNLYKKVSNEITLIKIFPATSTNQTVSVFRNNTLLRALLLLLSKGGEQFVLCHIRTIMEIGWH